MVHVYILRSQFSGKLYAEMTKYIERRLEEHNKGKSKYTKGHLARDTDGKILCN